MSNNKAIEIYLRIRPTKKVYQGLSKINKFTINIKENYKKPLTKKIIKPNLKFQKIFNKDMSITQKKPTNLVSTNYLIRNPTKRNYSKI